MSDFCCFRGAHSADSSLSGAEETSTMRHRCIVPVDGFFEWKAIKGQRAKQPYAVAMTDFRRRRRVAMTRCAICVALALQQIARPFLLCAAPPFAISFSLRTIKADVLDRRLTYCGSTNPASPPALVWVPEARLLWARLLESAERSAERLLHAVGRHRQMPQALAGE
jgi:hypothetical protein